MTIPQPTFIFAPGLTGRLDPRFTFTRNSVAYRKNRLGVLVPVPINMARINHDIASLKRLGYRAEAAFTELMLQTEDLSNASWTETNSSILANQSAGPTGATAMDQVTENASAGSHSVDQSITITAAAAVTVTGFARANSRSQFAVEVLAGAVGGRVHFDMTAGTATLENVSSGVANGGAMYAWPGGLWEYWAIITPGGAGTTAAIKHLLKNGTGLGAISYTGDGASNLHLGFINAYEGSSIYEYVPATTATMATSIELCTMPLGDWFNVVEGTIVLHARAPKRISATVSHCPFCLDDNTINERIFVVLNAGTANATLNIYDGGASQVAQAVSGIVAGADFKLAVAYKANDSAICLNGGTVGVDTSGTLPTLTTLRIGNDQQQLRPFNSDIARLAYYPKRLVNTDLQLLTS